MNSLRDYGFRISIPDHPRPRLLGAALKALAVLLALALLVAGSPRRAEVSAEGDAFVTAAGTWRHHACGDCVITLAVDDDAVWAGTASAGLIRHDRRTGEVRQITVEQGLFGRGILDIDISGDGGLWVILRSTIFGVPVGLGAWNGQRWVLHEVSSGLPSADVRKVLALDGGRAVVLMQQGLAAFDGRNWELQDGTRGLAAAEFHDLARSASGEAYAATSDGIFRSDGNRWHRIDSSGLPGSNIHWLEFGPEGELWVQGDDFVASSGDAEASTGIAWSLFPLPPPPDPGQGSDLPRLTKVDGLGRPWAVHQLSDPVLGTRTSFWILESDVWTQRQLDSEIGAYPGSSYARGTLYNGRAPIVFGKDSQIWIGHLTGGVSHFEGGGWTWLKSGIGPGILVSSSVESDLQGGVWAGGGASVIHPDRVLYHFDGNDWQHVGAAQGLPTGGLWGINANSLDVAPDGTLWLASDAYHASPDVPSWLAWSDGPGWSHKTIEELVPEGGQFASLAADDGGGVWLGTYAGAAHYQPSLGQTRRLTTADGLSGNEVLAIAVDRRSAMERVWFGTERGISLLESGRISNFTMVAGQAIGSVSSISVDAGRDAVWFGSSPELDPPRIFRLDRSGWTVFDAGDGLVGGWIRALVIGPDGALWTAMSDLIYRTAAIGRFSDGAWSIESRSDRFISPSLVDLSFDTQGRLWLATQQGLSEFIPAQPTTDPYPGPSPSDPPICICRSTQRKAPSAVVASIAATPGSLGGYGKPRDQGKPIGPFNPPRNCLGIHNAGLAYHPLFNPLAWKAGCP
jgi:ligand-binding sensor domain-containing protein